MRDFSAILNRTQRSPILAPRDVFNRIAPNRLFGFGLSLLFYEVWRRFGLAFGPLAHRSGMIAYPLIPISGYAIGYSGLLMSAKVAKTE